MNADTAPWSKVLGGCRPKRQEHMTPMSESWSEVIGGCKPKQSKATPNSNMYAEQIANSNRFEVLSETICTNDTQTHRTKDESVRNEQSVPHKKEYFKYIQPLNLILNKAQKIVIKPSIPHQRYDLKDIHKELKQQKSQATKASQMCY